MIKLSCIIPAAGLSSRMNSFKPLLPLGSCSVIEKTVNTLLAADVKDIIVVTGHRSELLIPVLKKLGVKIVNNNNYMDGMFSTIKVGIKTLTREIDGFFLLPADYPLVKSVTLRKLIEEYGVGSHNILYPCFKCQRGHPPLISTRIINSILTWQGREGMRGLLREFEHEAVNVNVDDPGILQDMDTPKDYTKLIQLCRGC